MQAQIIKVQSGLIYQDKFSTLSGWTNDGSWSILNEPTLIAFGKLQENPLGPGATFDKDGIREPTPFIDDDGTYYMLYDGGDGVTGWTSFIARSYDRGATWEKLGQAAPGYDNGQEGTWAANAMGYLTKFGSKYYYYRVLSGSYFPPPNIGLPGVPYSGDVWEADNVLGPWTYKPEGFLAHISGTWTANENLPCSIVKEGNVYYLITEGQGVGSPNFQVGILSGPTPHGPWTQQNPAILNRFNLGDGRDPENAKLFFHPKISKWVMLSNLIAPTGLVTDMNVLSMSDSVTDWTEATHYRIQRICPMDGDNAIGVVAPINIPNGTYITPNGDVPIYYDTNPERYSDSGWHLGRKLMGSVLELSETALKFESGTSGVARAVSRSISHADFVAEFAVRFTNTTTGTNLTFSFRANGTNSYRLAIMNSQWLILQKIVSGTVSVVALANSGLTTNPDWYSRIKVIAVGTSIKAYIDGELQIDAVDGSHSSGTTIAFGGLNASNAEIRLFTMTTSENVVISGLTEFNSGSLKLGSGMVVKSVKANSGGVVTIKGPHYPLDVISVNGVDYTPIDGRVWGGDVYSVPSTAVGVALSDSATAVGGAVRKSLLPQADGVSSPAVRKALQVPSPVKFDGQIIIYVGDSITAGVAASNNAKRWTSVFTAAKGAVEINLGLNGRTLQGGGDCGGLHPLFDATIIPQKTDAQSLLFISLGTNDIGMNDGIRNATTYRTLLDNTVTYAVTTKGWPVSSIVLVTPYYMGSVGWTSYVGSCGVSVPADATRHQAYVQAVIDTANSRGCVLANIYKAMLDYPDHDSLFAVDGVHPNDKGMAYIASFMQMLNYEIA